MGKGAEGIKHGEGKWDKRAKAKWMSVYLKGKRTAAKETQRKLKEAGCSLCGYVKCLAALEFHHVGDDKVRGVSDARTVKDVLKEAAKCIVVCANCHREIHSGLLAS